CAEQRDAPQPREAVRARGARARAANREGPRLHRYPASRTNGRAAPSRRRRRPRPADRLRRVGDHRPLHPEVRIMSFRRRTYPEVLENLITSLTGGVASESQPFPPPGQKAVPYTLALQQPPAAAVVSVWGARDG